MSYFEPWNEDQSNLKLEFNKFRWNLNIFNANFQYFIELIKSEIKFNIKFVRIFLQC